MLVFLIGVPINIAMLIKLIIDILAFEEEYKAAEEHINELE